MSARGRRRRRFGSRRSIGRRAGWPPAPPAWVKCCPSQGVDPVGPGDLGTALQASSVTRRPQGVSLDRHAHRFEPGGASTRLAGDEAFEVPVRSGADGGGSEAMPRTPALAARTAGPRRPGHHGWLGRRAGVGRSPTRPRQARPGLRRADRGSSWRGRRGVQPRSTLVVINAWSSSTGSRDWRGCCRPGRPGRRRRSLVDVSQDLLGTYVGSD